MADLAQARQSVTSYAGRKIRIMEVCGTHTHEIFRLGIRKLLPPQIELVSGPGCPVCVTPVSFIDEALWLAAKKGVTVCTFGDLLRVPGSSGTLSDARAGGADVRVVYSPYDAYEYAAAHKDKEVVFLSVGFETTTPGTCIAVEAAAADGLTGFSVLTANKTMPQAYEAMRGSCDAFLYPGHVHAVSGTALCEELARRGTSGVVAGFTAAELITALAFIVKKSQEGKPYFVNCYPRIVRPEGSPKGRAVVERVMESCDSRWRGLGVIKQSGMKLKAEFSDFDSRVKFDIPPLEGRENPACRCGDVLQGKCKPTDCSVFGKGCTPEHPVGACMVSGEGTCAAFYRYGGI